MHLSPIQLVFSAIDAAVDVRITQHFMLGAAFLHFSYDDQLYDFDVNAFGGAINYFVRPVFEDGWVFGVLGATLDLEAHERAGAGGKGQLSSFIFGVSVGYHFFGSILISCLDMSSFP